MMPSGAQTQHNEKYELAFEQCITACTAQYNVSVSLFASLRHCALALYTGADKNINVGCVCTLLAHCKLCDAVSVICGTSRGSWE